MTKIENWFSYLIGAKKQVSVFYSGGELGPAVIVEAQQVGVLFQNDPDKTSWFLPWTAIICIKVKENG